MIQFPACPGYVSCIIWYFTSMRNFVIIAAEVIGMPRKIREEILIDTEKKLKKLKAPKKKTTKQYSKKEALEILAPTIKTLHEKGFGYVEISQEVLLYSEGKIKINGKDIKKILEQSDTPPDSVILDTTSSEDATAGL